MESGWSGASNVRIPQPTGELINVATRNQRYSDKGYIDACKKYSLSGCKHGASDRQAIHLSLRTRPKIDGFVIICRACDYTTYEHDAPFYNRYRPSEEEAVGVM